MLTPPFDDRDRRRHDVYWTLEHLTGARVSERLWGQARRRTEKRLTESLEGFEGHIEPVPRVSDIAPEDFIRDYLDAGQPVVIEGAARSWGALERWSPQFFGERFPNEEIRLLRMAPEDYGSFDYDATITTLGEAMARLEEGNPFYCRFLPTLMKDPEVLADLDMPWFRARRGPLSGPGNLHLFIGGKGTETALHSAVSTNLFVQVYGTKRWWLYHPRWSWALKPPMERSMHFSSGFDPDRPDYDAFPEARHLRGYSVELKPGDILYNPPFWWHKVTNPTASIGVGFRWFPPHVCFRESPVQWLLTYLSVNPPFWRGAMLGLDFTKIYSVARRDR